MTIADRLAAKEKQELEIIEPLSPKDAADWKRLRKEVSLHQDAVCAFAECLTDIRDRRLYREEYGTFDAYVAAELSLSKRHINRLIHHEEVKRILGPMVPNVPESHARELVNVPPKKIPAIIKKADAKAKSEGRKREAKDVKAVVKEDVTVPKKESPPEPSHHPKEMAGPLMAHVKTLTQMLNDLKKRAVDRGGEWIDVQAISTQISALKYSLKSAIYYADCPACGGKRCAKCKQTGFLPELKSSVVKGEQ